VWNVSASTEEGMLPARCWVLYAGISMRLLAIESKGFILGLDMVADF
jgi:hypothetical protein